MTKPTLPDGILAGAPTGAGHFKAAATHDGRHRADILSPAADQFNRALERASNAPLRHGNRLTLLRNGPATYDDWLAAIAGAERFIHLENYIFQDDATGRRFADALAAKAADGVPVRVLVDWFGSCDVPLSFWRRLRGAGVDLRIFNPPGFSDPLKVVQRDHRKMIGVDGCYASVGGVCIADPWMDTSPVTGLPYRDTAVAVRGPAVVDLERAFASIWQLSGPPLPPEELLHAGAVLPAGDVAARVIIQEPGRMRMLRVLQLLLAGVQERIWIADAYFLVSAIVREALIAAARDGVDVRILLPASNDLPLVGVMSRYGYRPLLEAGVRIWEYTGLMMHAKTTVADGWWSRIGSTNLNPTGLLTNWEIDLVAEDRTFGAAMEAMYLDDLAHAREIKLRGMRRLRPRPERPESRAERRARRHRTKRSVRVSVIAARVGAALAAAGDDVVSRNEWAVGTAMSSGLLSLSLLAFRFPRALAWPLALVGALLGTLGLLRQIRPSGGHQFSRARRAELFRRQLQRIREGQLRRARRRRLPV
jgi:cardiolipin synthase